MNPLPPLNDILGAAVFDLNGLPREYYTTEDNQGTEWVQTVFQALSLKALITASLRIEGFQGITIRTENYDAIVVQLNSGYTALLFKKAKIFVEDIADPAFDEWVRNFEASILRNSNHFQTV